MREVWEREKCCWSHPTLAGDITTTGPHSTYICCPSVRPRRPKYHSNLTTTWKATIFTIFTGLRTTFVRLFGPNGAALDQSKTTYTKPSLPSSSPSLVPPLLKSSIARNLPRSTWSQHTAVVHHQLWSLHLASPSNYLLYFHAQNLPLTCAYKTRPSPIGVCRSTSQKNLRNVR